MPGPRTSDRITRVARPQPGEEHIAQVSLRQPSLRDFDAPRLRAELVALHAPDAPARIVLSLRGLTIFTSPCIATLTEVAESLARVGGSLVLCDVPPDAARVLKRTGLARTLRLARSPDHARRLITPRKTPSQAA